MISKSRLTAIRRVDSAYEPWEEIPEGESGQQRESPREATAKVSKTPTWIWQLEDTDGSSHSSYLE